MASKCFFQLYKLRNRASPLPDTKVYPTKFNSPHFNCKIYKLLGVFVKAWSTVITFLLSPITQTLNQVFHNYPIHLFGEISRRGEISLKMTNIALVHALRIWVAAPTRWTSAPTRGTLVKPAQQLTLLYSAFVLIIVNCKLTFLA